MARAPKRTKSGQPSSSSGPSSAKPATQRVTATQAKPPKPSKRPTARPVRFATGTFDARPDRLDFRDLRYAAPLGSLPLTYPSATDIGRFLPSYVQAGLVLDQGTDGACTGFGLAAVVNYLLWTRGLGAGGAPAPVESVSPRMLYELARRYDEWRGEAYSGSSCRGALKGWHKHGVCRQSLWPYRAQRRIGRPQPGWDADAVTRPLGVYYRIDRRSVVDLQAAIHQIGAIYVSAKVHDGWDRVPTLAALPASHDDAALPTIPNVKDESKTGGHAFALVGYNDRGFIVQNSWGESWGARGFAVLPYADWVVNGTDAWAVALGVPQHAMLSPQRVAALRWPSRGGRSLGFFDHTAKNSHNPPDDPWPIDRKFLYAPYEPWTTAQAYEHTLVTGNDGHVVITDLEAGVGGDAAAFVDDLVVTRAKAGLAQLATSKLVIYAHGGLNGEGESIDRIRVLAPYFEANGVYPLFLTWRTGPVETLLDILKDTAAKWLGLDDAARAEGWLDEIADARDRALEELARRTAKGLWSEMRENARRGAKAGRGLALLAESLGRLNQALGGRLELHLVGHSAGSILLGHLIERLAAVGGVKAASCSLYAAACSVAFAQQHYLGHGAQVLDPTTLHLHHLRDEEEKDDDLLSLGPVTVYGKSLLYLVSRALDDERKMPLVGLERTLDSKFNTEDQWATDQVPSVQKWQKDFKGQAEAVQAASVRVNRKGRTMQATHGSFDNNIDVIGATIERITGKPLVQPIEWLDY